MSRRQSASIATEPAVLPVTRRSRCTAFDAVGVHDHWSRTDPLLSFETFRLKGEAIPPHPHAGCGVALYLFDDSPGALCSRNAHGAQATVRPGDLLWLDTRCGTVHQEKPVDLSAECRGLSIVVHRPDDENGRGGPVQHTVSREQRTRWRIDDVVLTLVCGTWHDRTSADTALPLTLLMLDWQADAALPVDLDAARTWCALRIAGECRSGKITLAIDPAAPQAMRLPAGPSLLHGTAGTRVALLAGVPLRVPVVFRGAFAARDEAQLVDLLRRYQQGAMGALTG